VGNKEITNLRTSYATGMHGEIFAIIGSMGYIELACNRGPAATALAANRGTEVGIVIEGVTYSAPAPAAPAPSAPPAAAPA